MHDDRRPEMLTAAGAVRKAHDAIRDANAPSFVVVFVTVAKVVVSLIVIAVVLFTLAYLLYDPS